MKLKIIPMPLGWLEMSGAVLQRLRNFETDVFPCLGWLILGGETPIVVDTGTPEPSSGVKTVCKLLHSDAEFLVPTLARYGVKPEDVKIVINTHLHWDHIYGNDKLPNAKIYVQRAELEYADNPLPYDVKGFEKDQPVPFVSRFRDRIELIDGDARIAPGIRVMLTPGHTPGSQTALVDTESGVYALAGDLVTLSESLEFDPPWAPGVATNYYEYYDSIAKTRAASDVILPAHEKNMIGRVFPEA